MDALEPDRSDHDLTLVRVVIAVCLVLSICFYLKPGKMSSLLRTCQVWPGADHSRSPSTTPLLQPWRGPYRPKTQLSAKVIAVPYSDLSCPTSSIPAWCVW